MQRLKIAIGTFSSWHVQKFFNSACPGEESGKNIANWHSEAPVGPDASRMVTSVMRRGPYGVACFRVSETFTTKAVMSTRCEAGA